MARRDISGTPYYDKYDGSKGYTHLLARPGRAAQAREITEIQSTIKGIIKSLGDSLFKDGDVVEGCQVITKVDGEGNKVVTVTAGKVYLNGMVLPVEELATPIPLPLVEGVVAPKIIVGVQLEEEIITDINDDTLLDPATGYANYKKPGCDRLKSTTQIVVYNSEVPPESNDSAILATLIDGEISLESTAPEYNALTQTLARRTYDESGSYIVEGLNVRVEDTTDVPAGVSTSRSGEYYNVVIESGKAYVLGYELKIPAPRRIKVPRALTAYTVSLNTTYSSIQSYYSLTSNPFISSIKNVIGSVQKTDTFIYGMNTTTSEYENEFLETIVVNGEERRANIVISSVSQGGTTYTQATSESAEGDYYLRNSDGRYYIRWKGATHPTEGYTIVYRYEYLFEAGENKDYTISYSATDNSQGITWLDTVGRAKPEGSTSLTVEYEYYLARKDVVYIDYQGNINVVEGTPNYIGREVLPESPTNTLVLANISNPPGGSATGSHIEGATDPAISSDSLKILASTVGLTRFTMNDIQRLLNRLRNLEYNQSVLSLNDEARNDERVSDKKGIWTDPLIDFSKIDYNYNNSTQQVSYDATIDFDTNMCYLPTPSINQDLSYDAVNSTTEKYLRSATLKSNGDTTVLSQQKATKPFQINPYSVYPRLPEISITPSMDNWIDDTIITVPVSQKSSAILSTSAKNVERLNTRGSRRADTISINASDTAIGTKVSINTSESIINEGAITYIRQRDIAVAGSYFHPNLDNIKCYFDGVLVALTPTGDTVVGTSSDTIKADADGKFTAKFTIPDNILTGVREVRLESDENSSENYVNSSFALYQASGTFRNIQKTVTTLTTILYNRVTTVTTTHNIDPIGQTFILNRMSMIKSINLYFATKSEDAPVTCELREVVNGNITSTVYAHKTLEHSDINLPTGDYVRPTDIAPTRFDFDDPVLLEANKEYAFVVRSTSDRYRIYVAELGETDLNNNEIVLSNPYMVGVMMSSSNNSSWTVHQTTDIKFDLIADTYDSTSEIIFDNTTVTAGEEFSRVYLVAESLSPSGTSISWMYSVDNGATYKVIHPYNIELLGSMKSKMKIKAVLSTKENPNISPIVLLESASVILSRYSEKGFYISKNIPNIGIGAETGYSSVTVIVDSYKPSGTAINAWISTDKGIEILGFAESNPATADKIIGDNWTESRYDISDITGTPSDCKLYIGLSGTGYVTPAIRRIRMIMS